MIEEAFQCGRCGYCCRTLFEYQDGKLLGLALLTEEEKRLFGDENVMPQFSLGVERPEHVVSWQLNSAVCPFIGEDNRCTIYEKRPLACKSFPITNSIGRTIVDLKCPQVARRSQSELLQFEFSGDEGEAIEKINQHIWSCFRKYGPHAELWLFDLARRQWVYAKRSPAPR